MHDAQTCAKGGTIAGRGREGIFAQFCDERKAVFSEKEEKSDFSLSEKNRFASNAKFIVFWPILVKKESI